MARVYELENLVIGALSKKPITRTDDFLLYEEVLSNFVDTNMSLKDIFKNHVILGVPTLESISRCRRKVQERDPALKDPAAAEIRAEEEEEYKKYARGE